MRSLIVLLTVLATVALLAGTALAADEGPIRPMMVSFHAKAHGLVFVAGDEGPIRPV